MDGKWYIQPYNFFFCQVALLVKLLKILAGCSYFLLDIHSCHVLYHSWQTSHDRQHLKKILLRPSETFFLSALWPLTHEDEINNVRHQSQERTTKTELLKVPSIALTSSVSLLAPTGPSPELTIVILSVCVRGALTSAATRGRT